MEEYCQELHRVLQFNDEVSSNVHGSNITGENGSSNPNVDQNGSSDTSNIGTTNHNANDEVLTVLAENITKTVQEVLVGPPSSSSSPVGENLNIVSPDNPVCESTAPSADTLAATHPIARPEAGDVPRPSPDISPGPTLLLPESTTDHLPGPTLLHPEISADRLPGPTLLHPESSTDHVPGATSASAPSEALNFLASTWSGRMLIMSLPGIASLFWFLSSVPVLLVCECLRLRLSQMPKQPSQLSIRQVRFYILPCF